jgi:molecular chaperone DnaK
VTSDKAFVVGIDLGTTNSCVAEVSAASGTTTVIPNKTGNVTPSVLYFESPDRIIVGRTAKNLAAAKPELVCSEVKREMSKDPDHARQYSFHGVDYTPEQISACILTKLVADARDANGLPDGTPVKAVITVPAYFGTIGSNATQQAGKLADIEVIYVAPEPVAAAIAFGAARVTELQTVLVYDLGGGTFDVTVVQIDGRSARVVALDGERSLGGLDWDRLIADWARQSMVDEHGIELPTEDPVLNQQILERAEQAKHALSDVESTEMRIEHLGKPYTFDLSRERFEEITGGYLQTTIAKTKAVIAAAAEKGVTNLDHVLLVGGSSYMPCVAAAVKDATGLTPQVFKADTAVAEGAALLAAMIDEGEFDVDTTGTADQASSGSRPVTMLTPKSLGVEVCDPVRGCMFVSYIVPKKSELPAQGAKTFGTMCDQQTDMAVRIFEERAEESEIPEENTLLHETSISLPPGLPENSPVQFEFRIDDNSVLHVFVTELTHQKTWEMNVDKLRTASADDVARLQPARQAVA